MTATSPGEYLVQLLGQWGQVYPSYNVPNIIVKIELEMSDILVPVSGGYSIVALHRG
jgi:hypothetical protein